MIALTMEERKCEFKIVAFVDSETKEIGCDANNFCLRKLVWSGIGVKKAAAIALGLPNSEGVDAYVDGTCSCKSTVYLSSAKSLA